jgi:hypothetical protein
VVVCGLVLVRSLLAEAGEKAGHQSRIQPVQRLVLHPEALQLEGTQIGQDDVHGFYHPVYYGLARFLAQIYCDPLLVAVVMFPEVVDIAPDPGLLAHEMQQ